MEGSFDAVGPCHALSAGCVYTGLHPYVTSEMLQELGLAEYKVDTYSSDYDDYVDEVGFELDAHGA